MPQQRQAFLVGRQHSQPHFIFQHPDNNQSKTTSSKKTIVSQLGNLYF